MDRNVYKAMADVVGQEFISDDPVVLETYSFNWLTEFLPGAAPCKYMPHRPAAVVLPGSVEEVQQVVKICNRYGVKYKALSTGYGSHSLPGQGNVVVLDLRRMNRIVEINEEQGYAVVEPYVTWAQLAAEVMKKGYFTTPVQAGSQASVLANVTSGWGMNTFGNHGGHNGRNCLAVEWVLPTGELLKLGPPEGWFSGDGPGPSLRGIMRGYCGAQGALGVFTKVGIKLHHWPGPPELKTRSGGLMLYYRLDEIPEFMELFAPSFDTYEALADFMVKAGESEIAYSLVRAGGIAHMTSMFGSLSNQEIFENYHESGFLQILEEEVKHPCIVLIFARTKEEFEYKKAVLMDIIEETGGKILPPFLEGPFADLMKQEMPVALFGNDTHFIHHQGGFVISAGYMGNTDAVVRHMGVPAEKLKKKYMEKGAILFDGDDSTYHNSFDHGAYIYMEMEFHYDAALPDSVEASRKAIEEERTTRLEEKLGFEPNDIGLCVGDASLTPWERVKEISKRYMNFHAWQQRIKQALDPENISDGTNYGGGTPKPGQ